MLMISSKDIIRTESLNFSFFLKRTKSPSPALEHNPAIAAPKVIVPLISIIVSAIDTAQFGINPITDVITGCKNLCAKSGLLKKFVIIASLMKKFKISVIIKINANTLSVCITG